MDETSLYLNEPQGRVLLIDPRIAVLVYGRRLGKSSVIIAYLTAKRAFDMPGASFLILGKTYKQVLERTLAATKTGWKNLGYYEDVHYVIGKKPPKSWPQPLFLPSDWSHTITWITGTTFSLGSQDREGLVNSLTCHGLFGDEAKFFDETRFEQDALPVVSAPLYQFPDSPHNRSIVLCTSMPSLPKGQWIFDYEKLMDKDQISLILSLSVRIEQMREKFHASDNHQVRENLACQIRRDQEALRLLRMGDPKEPGCVYYDEASTLANLPVIGWDYILQQKKVLKDKFDTEILNIRPRKSEGAFYSKMEDRHWISMMDYAQVDKLGFSDNIPFSCLCDNYHRDAPLCIGMDFGANINCIVTAQRDEPTRTMRILKEHWLKAPSIQDDVVQAWCAYYKYHSCKEVRFHFDNTGNNSTGNTRQTRAEQVKKILETNGWTVHLMTRGGANMRHEVKHLLINTALSEMSARTGDASRLYKIRFNEPNLEALRESISYAEAIEGRDGAVQKNKKSEKSKTIPQQYATHLSDAFDSLYMGEFSIAFTNQEEIYQMYATMM